MNEAYPSQCITSTANHGPQVHVWGLIEPYSSDPWKIITGHLNSEKYQRLILENPLKIGGLA